MINKEVKPSEDKKFGEDMKFGEDKKSSEDKKLSKDMMPSEDEMIDLAELFKVFGDSTRIRILFVLFQKEQSVGDITNLLGMTQSAISHQLKFLKTAKLVGNRREGKSIYYFLADDHVRTIIEKGMEHIQE